MIFLQYILPNLISVVSLLISVILGYLTYKLDKTAKWNDNEIIKQKLEIENLREQNNLVQNKITETIVNYFSNADKKSDEKNIKKTEKNLEYLIKINNDRTKKEKTQFELKIFLINKK